MTAVIYARYSSHNQKEESIEQQKQREQLEKQIVALEAKIRKEKQPRKKFELVQNIKVLKEGLKHV